MLKTPPKVRLAGPESPAPEVFNFYQITSLLSGLYIKAADREEIDGYKKALEFGSDLLLRQIGELYDLWHLALKHAGESIPVPADVDLIARLRRFANRIVAIEEQLTLWTPASRWARVLCLIEVRYERCGRQICAHNPYVAEKLAAILDQGISRRERLVMMEDSALTEERDLRGQFAIPVAL